MTVILPDMAVKKKQEPTAGQPVAAELVRQARDRGLFLTGPDGLLKQLTKTTVEAAALRGQGSVSGRPGTGRRHVVLEEVSSHKKNLSGTGA